LARLLLYCCLNEKCALEQRRLKRPEQTVAGKNGFLMKLHLLAKIPASNFVIRYCMKDGRLTNIRGFLVPSFLYKEKE